MRRRGHSNKSSAVNMENQRVSGMITVINTTRKERKFILKLWQIQITAM